MHHQNQLYSLFITVLISMSLVACDPGQPGGTSDFVVTGRAAALTQSEFNQLGAEDQYKVATKLYGTFFRGIPADEFYDLSSSDTTTLTPTSSNFINDTRTALRTGLSFPVRKAVDDEIDGIDEDGNPIESEAKYSFNNEDRPRQIPLARIKEYPVSRDLFVNWMTYFLVNTIMFSPAVEMESTEAIDAQGIFRRLANAIESDVSIRSIISTNLSSIQRWRVSRSAENHALEAYELYLGLFETEEDSYRGGIACREYFLTDDESGYQLSVNDFPNYTPQLILDNFYVTNCSDLYEVIAGHPLLMPRVTEVIVNYLFSGRTLEDRLEIIQSIVNSNPETFEDIFSGLLFSREYLLHTERPKSFEENLMSMLDALKWNPAANSGQVNKAIFENMSTKDGSSQMQMKRMGWDSMYMKIGRLPDVPLDALSFANYHKAIREEYLKRTDSYSGRSTRPSGLVYDDDGDVHSDIAAMTVESYIDYLFLNVVQRKANATEKNDFYDLIVNVKNYTNTDSDTGVEIIRDDRFDDIASLVFDYISRLPEFYYFKSVQS